MHTGGIEPLIRAASDAGATGIHLERGLVLGDLAEALPAVLRSGLVVPSMALPMAPRALAAHKRLPALAASDPEERGAAITLAIEGLESGLAAGVRWALLDFGPVALPVARREVAVAFARRELGEGEVGAPELALALAVRKAQAEGLVDACRWSLERLARVAEARGVTLLVPVGASPWEVPSAREALALLEAFRGAPLALAWQPGRLTAARALGLRLPKARIEAIAAAAGAALETDAVGLDAGYLPGLGERDAELPPRPKLPAGAPVIVAGSPTFTDAEIAAAVARCAALYDGASA
jgi:hypothetical protein